MLSTLHFYWDGESSEIAETVDAWEHFGLKPTVWGPAAITELMRNRWGSAAESLFDRIRIPSCRSDIARTVLLHAVGGLYADVHIGPPQAQQPLSQFIALLNDHELVVPRITKANGARALAFGFLLAREASTALDTLIQHQLQQLADHSARESATPGHVPYNIHQLVAASRVATVFLQSTSSVQDYVPKPEFADRVRLPDIEITGASRVCSLYRFYSYRQPGDHWSERQKSEPLFSRADLAHEPSGSRLPTPGAHPADPHRA